LYQNCFETTVGQTTPYKYSQENLKQQQNREIIAEKKVVERGRRNF